MNRIDRLFHEKKGNILSIYFTAGFPSLNDTVPILTALESAGADMAEIGIPFSDPLADGPVIQQSSQRALENGMSLTTLFRQLEGIRQHIKMPLILMGYLNPILQFGMEKFLKTSAETGIDGVIIPDLPMDEYQDNYASLFSQYEIYPIMLITPQTPVDRVRMLDSISRGFLYMVSSASTTGTQKDPFALHEAYFKEIASMKLRNPRMIGFGISNRLSFTQACSHAQGAIIGTAFIRAIEKNHDLSPAIHEFIGRIK